MTSRDSYHSWSHRTFIYSPPRQAGITTTLLDVFPLPTSFLKAVVQLYSHNLNVDHFGDF